MKITKALQDHATEALKLEQKVKQLPAYLVAEYGDHVYLLRHQQQTIKIID